MPAPLASTIEPQLVARRALAPARAHLVGIAGSGMGSLADVLAQAGWEISGSDVAGGHDADFVKPDLDFVIHSTAVGDDNPELLAARRLGIPVLSFPQMLGRLMALGTGLAVAGTHGKSTVAAMAAHLLWRAGLDPTAVFGARPIGQRSGGRLGGGPHVLIEACEYRQNFLELSPAAAVLLGIEADHFDCFESPRHVERAFERFVARLPDDGVLLAADDCAAARRVAATAPCRCEWFGHSETCDWQAANLTPRRGYYQFELRHHGRALGQVRLHVPGRHNVTNALAAAALAVHAGVSEELVGEGLESFRGLHRRLELLGSVGGVWLVDDYAHHPTAVAATLATVREMFPGQRLHCVFQPHQASRTAALLDQLAHSLQNVDKLYVTEIYRVREGEPRPGEVTADDLAARAAELGAVVEAARAIDQIERRLVDQLRAGDVLTTIGAGDIGQTAHGLGKRLRRNLATR